MKRPLKILEVGCGNGWLANKLSSVKNTLVTGFDINQMELEQAKRVFGRQHNLRFTHHDPLAPGASKEKFDVIVFAASIQYFSSLEKLIRGALHRLQPNGSIHIIDTHFYRPDEVDAAKQRTEEYYTSLGFPGLSEHYFHHSLDALARFNCCILFDPRKTWNRLMRRKDPFHWICIKNN